MTDTEILDWLVENRCRVHPYMAGWSVSKGDGGGIWGPSIRSCVMAMVPPPSTDDGYIRVPAVGQRVRIRNASALNGMEGTVHYVGHNAFGEPPGVDVRIDRMTSIPSFKCDDVEPIDANPKFILFPK